MRFEILSVGRDNKEVVLADTTVPQSFVDWYRTNVNEMPISNNIKYKINKDIITDYLSSEDGKGSESFFFTGLSKDLRLTDETKTIYFKIKE